MALITCPKCGKNISDKAKNCKGCGASMEEMREIIELMESKSKTLVCPECGTEFGTDEEDCPECGFPTEELIRTLETDQSEGSFVVIEYNVTANATHICVCCDNEYNKPKLLCPKCGYPRISVTHKTCSVANGIDAYRGLHGFATQNTKAVSDYLEKHFDYGINVPEDVRTMVEKAFGGDSEAENNLGIALDCGLGCKANKEEAVKWYRKAAEQGSAKGQVRLGYALQHGMGCDSNIEEAMKWFRKAAEQGAGGAKEKVEELKTFMASQFIR